MKFVCRIFNLHSREFVRIWKKCLGHIRSIIFFWVGDYWLVWVVSFCSSLRPSAFAGKADNRMMVQIKRFFTLLSIFPAFATISSTACLWMCALHISAAVPSWWVRRTEWEPYQPKDIKIQSTGALPPLVLSSTSNICLAFSAFFFPFPPFGLTFFETALSSWSIFADGQPS